MGQRLQVFIQAGAKPPDNKPLQEETNCKPVVAIMFAIIPALAGAWSSRRRPWKGGKERMAVAKAFSITSLPFIVAEAATGVVSFLTGELRIPPTGGAGMAADLAILLAGIVIVVFRIMEARHDSERY